MPEVHHHRDQKALKHCQLLYTTNKSWPFWQKVISRQLFFFSKRNLNIRRRKARVYNVLCQTWSLLSGQVASAACLEANNDICDLQVPLFFQMSKDSSSEKHFTLSNSVKVGIQLQCFDLKWEREEFISHKDCFMWNITKHICVPQLQDILSYNEPLSPTKAASSQ